MSTTAIVCEWAPTQVSEHTSMEIDIDISALIDMYINKYQNEEQELEQEQEQDPVELPIVQSLIDDYNLVREKFGGVIMFQPAIDTIERNR